MFESTQDKIIRVEGRIPDSANILGQIITAIAPLKSRVEQLESQMSELKQDVNPSRLHRIERDIAELFLKVDSLYEDAKKGEGYRDLRPEVSIASVAALYPHPPSLTGTAHVCKPISGEHGTGKRKRAKDTDEQPKSKKKLNLGGTSAKLPNP